MIGVIPHEMPSWERVNALMCAAQMLANRGTRYIDEAKNGDWQYWAMRSIRAQRASLRMMRNAERYVPRHARYVERRSC